MYIMYCHILCCIYYGIVITIYLLVLHLNDKNFFFDVGLKCWKQSFVSEAWAVYWFEN